MDIRRVIFSVLTLILLVSVSTMSSAEMATLYSPYEPYSTHTVEAEFGTENWDYQQIGVGIHIGRLFAWEERGLARFNTNMLPANAVIESINLKVMVIQFTLDPSTLMDVTSLYVFPTADNPVEVAQSMTTVYANDLTTMLQEGLHTIPLNQAAVDDLQNALDNGQSWWGVGFTGTNDGPYTDGIIEGYNGYNPPYLEITYTGDPPLASLRLQGVQTSIPAAGGPLSYILDFSYGLPYPTPGLSYWAMIDSYSGTWYGPVLYQRFTANPGMEVLTSVFQDVPGWFEPGDHNYIGYVGYYPNAIIHESFVFFKFFGEADGATATGASDWTSSGGFSELAGAGEELQSNLPDEFSLSPAFPNPFNPTTSLNLTMPEAGAVQVTLHNTLGQQVMTILSGDIMAGEHTIKVNGSDLAGGIYFVQATLPNGDRQLQKIILLK